MGDYSESINVTLKNGTYLEDFKKSFYEILKDYLYDKKFKIENYHIHNPNPKLECHIFFGREPLFKMNENGAQVDLFVKEYLKRYSDADFHLDYTCENLSSDGAINITYTYTADTKKLIIERKFADSISLSYCPECEEYFDEPLAYIDEYYEDSTYVCPSCGYRLTLDIETKVEVIKL